MSRGDKRASSRKPTRTQPKRGSTPIIHHQSSIINAGGFTLIELLVVISIVALLMAVLLPALSRVRKQAKAVVCQSRLRELGLLSAIYVQEHIGSPGASEWASPVFWHGRAVVDRRLQFCPSAPTPLPGPIVPWGDAFHAYAFGRVDPTAPPEKRSAAEYFSYGCNGWLDHAYSEAHPWKGRPWRTRDVKEASRVPVIFDCAWMYAGLDHLDPPPEQPFTPPSEPNPSLFPDRVSSLCIERHGEGINMLFLDWSVRKVGLKELWTLKWHAKYDTGGPWTKAGGAQPEDWPAWMRKFKDY